ncbi:MAG: radical SAM family heme chaperone HemW [Acidobacteria bacterium]|nr:radical SAM family heme chaperone HemW [Acidobacteriota bacterium]
MPGLYLHLPFCARRCDYCDFYVLVGRDDAKPGFVETLAAEIRRAGAGAVGDERRADTIYFGGGTPSSLAPAGIAALIAACREAFEVAPYAEVTLEANPEGIDRSSLDAWLAAGVNRLSVGVQVLDDDGLRRRGRLHTAAKALDSIDLAHRAGFTNVNADLIAGLPTGDFVEGFGAGLLALLDRRPEHLSVYLFEADKDTPLMRAVRAGSERLPDDDDVAAAYEAACGLTRASGYEQYEIANFSRPGRRSRHNLKYWTGEPYLGFGPAAHSFFRGRRYSAPRDLDAWTASVRAGSPAAEASSDYTLASRESAAREALVLNLRLTEGVDLELFDRMWGTDARAWIRDGAADAIDAGLISLEGARARLTERGMVLANEVFSRLTSA